jgi:uncharacterized protein (DUF1499 family)
MKRKNLAVRLVLIGIAFALFVLFALLEDWKRDLTTNYAQLDENASDPSLRPMVFTMSAEEVASRVTQWAETMPRWELQSREQTADHLQLHFTRRTRVLRFTDDVYVQLSERDGETRLDAESRSRFGKGDLGQNPRNLRELTNALRR